MLYVKVVNVEFNVMSIEERFIYLISTYCSLLENMWRHQQADWFLFLYYISLLSLLYYLYFDTSYFISKDF